MLDIVGFCWVVLEWFDHPTQQNQVRASVMLKVCTVLNSFSWVEGSYGCDLRKAKTKYQVQAIKMLLNAPLSFLLLVYFLVLPHLSFISLFSSPSPEISISSFSFHLIVI